MRKYLERLLRTTIVAATALVAGLPSAQAGYYTGSWDPWFGVPLGTTGTPNVGFEVVWTGTYGVIANCPTDPSGPAGPSGNISACVGGATVDSATVTLKREGGSQTSTIDFGPLSMLITDLFWEFNPNPVISKLKTTPTNSYAVAPASGDALLDSALALYEFSLQFFMNGDAPAAPLGSIAGYSGPVLYARQRISSTNAEIWRADVTNPDERYHPKFRGLTLESAQEIPEPGALALVAIGLLAGGLAQRRRSVRV